MVVILADDDEDDRSLVRDALMEANSGIEVRTVVDGQDLLDYLRGHGAYAGRPSTGPAPMLVLLDLHMPRLTGSEALVQIRADESLRALPVVVLTTSRREEDILESYLRGANSFISKPSSYSDLVKAMATFQQYWAGPVSLPDRSA